MNSHFDYKWFMWGKTTSEGGKFKEYRSIDPDHLFNPKAGTVTVKMGFSVVVLYNIWKTLEPYQWYGPTQVSMLGLH